MNAWTNTEGILIEPYSTNYSVGYHLTDTKTGREEYIILSPIFLEHPEPSMDTWVYHLDAGAVRNYQMDENQFKFLTDYGYPAVRVSHFTSFTEPDEDPVNDEWEGSPVDAWESMDENSPYL